MPTDYENIRIVTYSGPASVRGRIISGTLFDGERIRVGVDRRAGMWTFTDLESGGLISAFEDFDVQIAIQKFHLDLVGIDTAQLQAARVRLFQEMGGIEETD